MKLHTIRTRTPAGDIVLSSGKTVLASSLADGDVVAADNDGTLVCWDANGQTVYNCGETVEEYGMSCLNDEELERLGLAAPENAPAHRL